ncbi:MAG: hypothetical protein AMXMBFR48_24070 [Ignavibacteriales bacterium]
MNSSDLTKLDELYSLYGYESKEIKGIKTYVFTKGIYNGVDIIKRGNEKAEDELREEFTKGEYAVKMRNFKSLEEAEDSLFRDFFKSEGVTSNLKKRYNNFIKKMMTNLPEDANYEYINCSFNFSEFDNNLSNLEQLEYLADDNDNSLVSKVAKEILSHNGPLLIIIEAAAGYGKTCTAYEILKRLLLNSGIKLPFFTELSRDRSARIFKHILQFEIEDQFANSVDSKLVIHQIRKGRIPLIIDGFDELISKDFSFTSSQFEQVESMLSTIIDLLQENAKIVITSRKTAIFNGEEFHNYMTERNIEYTFQRFSISEPKIDNWLSKDKISFLENKSFPINQIANPVLLTYLRYISSEELEMIIEGDESIVDRYFDFLLKREQIRQQLPIDPETQKRIFRKMVRLFTEWDIKSETKQFIKDLLLDYNRKIIEETRQKYTPDKRPRVDQLADILSNHAFLDRKESGNIGIVNEFVLGTLIGENMILGKYDQYNTDYYKDFNQMFAILAVQSFQVQTQANKEKLWNEFDKRDFNYDPNFYFLIDTSFAKRIARSYQNTTLKDYKLSNFSFIINKTFDSVVFMECVFRNCLFSPESFVRSSFVNCKFYGCEFVEGVNGIKASGLSVYGCTDDNGFLSHVYEHDLEIKEETISIEKEILELYFKKGSFKPRYRQLSKIKAELSIFDNKIITKTILRLEKLGYIVLNGDLSFLTKDGITFYIENYRNNNA